MGKVILEHYNGNLESLKCKSEARAKEIAGKRPSVKGYTFYEKGEIIPIRTRKKEAHTSPYTLEEMEKELYRRGIL